MSLPVLLPLIVLGVLVVAAAAVVARTLDEFVQLRLELQRLGRLRPALAEVEDGRRRLQAALARRSR